MTATSIEVDTRIINNDAFGPPNSSQYEQVNTTISFSRLISNGVRTLSTNSASVGSSPKGLLYVPTLELGDPCNNASAPYVPKNATRIADLPSSDFPPIAIGPWLSPQCVQNYLASAKKDLVGAFVFYQPDQGDGAPPVPSDWSWGLNDGGQWKGQNPYPVYAISSYLGQLVMDTSSLYSGPNLTTAPNSSQLVQTYDRNDFAKLYIDISLSTTGGLPSLWIFLVAILAVLVSIVGIVSTIMHFIQRRRRHQLRRRVANGEVDLEIIGVKRLLVPRDLLDKMPVHRYEKVDHAANLSYDEEPAITSSDSASKTDTDKRTSRRKSRAQVPRNHFDQPSCAICLDDFVPDDTMVRQLPCGHIFHPECVDIFLTQNSSLCPLCKKSVLPVGYCPAVITNTMVRRERTIRRARERAARLGVGPEDAERIAHMHMVDRFRLRRHDEEVEMGTQQRPTSRVADALQDSEDGATSPHAQTQAATPATDRLERARRRAVAMLGPDAAPLDPEGEQSRVPLWRRCVRRVFPTSS